MIKTEFLVTGEPGDTARVWIDEQEIFPGPSQRIRNHSPTGFNWGYGGSGPAQLALAFCLHVFEKPALAQALYQDFKFRFVAAWPKDKSFTILVDVTDFLIDHGKLITPHR